MPCGSMPISHQKKTFNKIYKSQPYTYSKDQELIQKISAFREFKDLCKNNGIQFIVAIPPNFRTVTRGFKDRLLQVMNGYGEVWMYDSLNPVYSNSNYFFDNAHLQTNGSYVYTNELIRYYAKINGLKFL